MVYIRVLSYYLAFDGVLTLSYTGFFDDHTTQVGTNCPPPYYFIYNTTKIRIRIKITTNVTLILTLNLILAFPTITEEQVYWPHLLVSLKITLTS